MLRQTQIFPVEIEKINSFELHHPEWRGEGFHFLSFQSQLNSVEEASEPDRSP